MKIFSIRRFEQEELDKFIQFSNEFGEEDWELLLESVGGSNIIMDQYLYILNRRVGVFKDTLNVIEAFSNGWKLAILYKGTTNVLPGARGMFHLSYVDSSLTINNLDVKDVYSNYTEFRLRENQNILDRDMPLVKSLCSLKDYKNYLKGMDVYFDEKQLKSQICKK